MRELVFALLMYSSELTAYLHVLAMLITIAAGLNIVASAFYSVCRILLLSTNKSRRLPDTRVQASEVSDRTTNIP